MKAAFVLFDKMTTLDFIGFYDAVTRLKTMKFMDDFSWNLCAQQAQVSDDRGLKITADTVGASLAGYDLLFIPGGFGTRPLQHDRAFVEWIATAKDVPLKTSVCTGSLLF